MTMDAVDQSVAPAALAQSTKVPIAQLSPTLEQVQEKSIDATVTLVWPYSSSTKSLSLLLAEPDFRLRRSHGQVKATFHGHIAEQVATSHVGIGDNVRLALKGSNFVANNTATQTPGRYVAWDLHFESGLSLEVNRSSKDTTTIIIEHFDQVPCEPEQLPPSTPRVTSAASEGLEQALWESPAFLRPSSIRRSAVYLSSLEGNGDEDGSVPGKGRKRPRYSLNRDDWHLVEDPMSPQEKEPASNWWEKESWERTSEDSSDDEPGVEAFEEPEPQSNVPMDGVEAEAQGSSDPAPRETSPIFIKPSLELLGTNLAEKRLQTNDTLAAPISTSTIQNPLLSHFQLPTDTPQLRPIPSPGLPIPSPIVSHPSDTGGYFSETRAFYAPTHSASLEANAHIAVSEPIPFSNLSPVSSPDAPEVPFENHPDAIETHQPALTSVGLAIDQFALPSTSADQEVVSNLLVDEREKSMPSEYLDDAEIDESAIVQGDIAEHYSAAEAAQAAVESMELGAVQEESFNRVGYDVDHTEYSDINASSGNGAEEENSEVEEIVPGPSQYEDDMSDNHITRASSDVEEQPSDVESFSGASRTEQYHYFRRRSVSEDESNVAEDDVSEEEAVSYHQDEYSEGQSDEETGESDAEDLPRQSGPPEVIVLDSDSEDELTSDHPAVPQSAYRDDRIRRVSTPRSEDEEFDMSEQDEGSDEEVEEVEESEPNEESGPDEGSESDEGSGFHELEAELEIEAEPLGQDDRVHDSDKEDESSVDVLARDHYPVQYSSRGSSIHEDAANENVVGPSAEAEGTSYGGDHHDDSIKTHSNTNSLIYLDSDEDGPGDAENSTFPREDSAPASRIERAWSGYLHTLDGADDRDLESTGFSTEPNEQLEVGRDTGASLNQSAGQQLLTPDPTQEMMTGSQAAATSEVEMSSDQDTQESSMGLNLSLPPTSGHKAIDSALPVDHDTSEHLKQEPTPDAVTEVVTRGDPSSIPLVVVPTAEIAPPHDQSEACQEEIAGTSNAVTAQLPAPDRHAHGLRSKLSYFAPLATLADHLGSLVDTISIVHETSPIAKATPGSKEYSMTIQITDPSMAGTTLNVPIFRRYKSAMPTLVEGNAVLLRNFKVQSQGNSIMLLSVQSSSWAVFDGSGPDAKVNGPPVEYRSEERAFASGLRNWYREIGANTVADHQLQSSVHRDDMDREDSALISEAGSVDSISRDPTSSARSSRRRKSHRRVTIHELRDGRRYAEVGSPSTKESIHELRDGTVYANI